MEKDCFERYEKELNFAFIGTLPTPEFKAVLDVVLEIKAVEKTIWEKYGLQEDFDDWLKRQNPHVEYIAGFIPVIENLEYLKLTYMKEKVGASPEVLKYEEMLNRHKEMVDVFRRNTQYKQPLSPTDPILLIDPEVSYDKLYKMYCLFDIIKNKYGVTREEFYLWLRSKNIRGKTTAGGIAEVIPGMEMYVVEFLRETIGNTPETRVFEQLASEFAAEELSASEQTDKNVM